jgi:hypothetical protein
MMKGPVVHSFIHYAVVNLNTVMLPFIMCQISLPEYTQCTRNVTLTHSCCHANARLCALCIVDAHVAVNSIINNESTATEIIQYIYCCIIYVTAKNMKYVFMYSSQNFSLISTKSGPG